MNTEESLEGIVDQPVDVVWSLITNPKKFHSLRIPHTYGPYATGDPRRGSAFECRSLMGDRWLVYVVDCEKFREFSFGPTEDLWTFHFSLKDQGQKAVVRYTRRFAVDGFWERIFGVSNSSRKNNKHLTQITFQKLAEACSRLAAGQSDGLTET